jgi:hypothetical protein
VRALLEKARRRTHLVNGEAPDASPHRPWPVPLRRRSGRRAVRGRPGRSRPGRDTTPGAGVDEASSSPAGTTAVLRRGRRRVAVGGRVAEAQIRAVHIAASALEGEDGSAVDVEAGAFPSEPVSQTRRRRAAGRRRVAVSGGRGYNCANTVCTVPHPHASVRKTLTSRETLSGQHQRVSFN